MDAQTDVGHTAVLAALVQTLARLELEEGWLDPAVLAAGEALAENRFLAARDGLGAEFLDVGAGARVSCEALLARMLPALAPHAEDLGTEWALEALEALEVAALDNPAWQRTIAAERGLAGLVEALAGRFADPSRQGD